MSFFQSAILGAVQGLTEFLPVSSSGHLVLVQNLFGFQEPLIAFDIILHFGTLTAVVLYFWKDFFEMIRQSLLFLIKLPGMKDREAFFRQYPYALEASFVIISCIPTGIIGYVFKDAFHALFGSVLSVGLAWVVMGIILIISRKFQNGDRELNMMNHRDAFIIGLVQGIAIIPGISRSGSTILAAMLCGIERKEAARFSFWMSVPAILGAFIFELDEGLNFAGENLGILLTGFIVAAIVGFLTIACLLNLVKKGKFYYFGFYCLLLGICTLIYFSLPLLNQ